MSNLIAFKYYGGKFYLLKHILSLIPPHSCYVEVFGGSGVVLLNKPVSKVEIFNDLNNEVYTFFKALREKPEELIRLLELTPYHRRELTNICQYNNDSELEIARKFFVKVNMNFNAISGPRISYSISINRNVAAAYSSKINNLNKVLNRLRRVTFENKDFIFIFKNYLKESKVFAYLDPPYIHSSRKTTGNDYKHEMTDEQHEEMLKLCVSSPAKILISGYDNELYNDYLKNWNRKEIKTKAYSSSSPNNRSKPSRIEVLWYNYKINHLFF